MDPGGGFSSVLGSIEVSPLGGYIWVSCLLAASSGTLWARDGIVVLVLVTTYLRGGVFAGEWRAPTGHTTGVIIFHTPDDDVLLTGSWGCSLFFDERVYLILTLCFAVRLT